MRVKARGWRTVLPVVVAGGLCSFVVFDSGLHSASLTESSAVAVASTAQDPGPPPFKPAEILKKNGDNWVIPWNTVLAYATRFKFDATYGEKDHVLWPKAKEAKDQAVASIYPSAEIWNMKGGDLFTGRILAVVKSKGRSDHLGLVDGDNYLLFYRGNSAQMVMLNREKRTPIKVHYEPHGQVAITRAMAVDLLGLALQDRTKFLQQSVMSVAALRCAAAGWKACFVDSAEEQVVSGATAGAPGIGYGLGPTKVADSQIFYSQVWVACIIYGCCCGGQQCHN